MGTYKKRFIIILCLAVFVVGISFLLFAGKHASVDSQFVDAETKTTAAAKGKGKGVGQAVVYVTGAVSQPGMYNLKGHLRVNELVTLAGGLLPDADVSKVNLAHVVKDGMHINIPFIKEKSLPVANSSRQVRKRQTSAAAEPVNVNTATAEELAGVSGISLTMAAKIVAYRDSHGAFTSFDDLLKVNGLSQKQLHKLQDKIVL